jgi:hypothetical protein
MQLNYVLISVFVALQNPVTCSHALYTVTVMVHKMYYMHVFHAGKVD